MRTEMALTPRMCIMLGESLNPDCQTDGWMGGREGDWGLEIGDWGSVEGADGDIKIYIRTYMNGK
jgi:hypothetical protein